jgi:hypothetical protein
VAVAFTDDGGIADAGGITIGPKTQQVASIELWSIYSVPKCAMTIGVLGLVLLVGVLWRGRRSG